MIESESKIVSKPILDRSQPVQTGLDRSQLVRTGLKTFQTGLDFLDLTRITRNSYWHRIRSYKYKVRLVLFSSGRRPFVLSSLENCRGTFLGRIFKTDVDAEYSRNYGMRRATVHFALKSAAAVEISINTLCYGDLYKKNVNRN